MILPDPYVDEFVRVVKARLAGRVRLALGGRAGADRLSALGKTDVVGVYVVPGSLIPYVDELLTRLCGQGTDAVTEHDVPGAKEGN